LRVEEKSILLRFVGLYHISTFILLSIIAFLIYNMQYQSVYNLTISNLETISSKISSKIITSDMKKEELNFESLCSSDLGIKFALYDNNEELVFTDASLPTNINFHQKNYLEENQIFTIDKSTKGHMDIYSVVMMNESFQDKIHSIIVTIIVGFIAFYVVLCAIGFYLIKLFMKPIENERTRLDNFIKDTTHELERIYLSAKRISEIYKDLTHLFLETNKKKEQQTIQLDSLISNELHYFELLASKKNISTHCTLEKTQIIINKEDIKRIFSNIFSNAIKYTKRGGKISITLQNNILRIQDNGIGINLKDKKNIFNRYYRATTQDGGFGMGLNIVYAISKEYDIKIDVESELDVGSTFSLDFSQLSK